MSKHHLETFSVQYEDLHILGLGAPLESGVVPTVIYFSLTAQDSLLVDPYNQPTIQLLKSEKVRIFSITLPFHGDMPPEEALRMWAKEMEHGRDPLTPFIEKVAGFLSYLNHRGLAQEDRIALMGVSRGGWVACQVAAKARVKTVVGFAPLTQFSKSPFFSSVTPIAKHFDLDSIAEQLVGTPLHFWISNRDTRVGTRSSFEFIENLVEKSWDRGIRSPEVYLRIVPPIGTQGHGTSKESFIQGAEWALQQITQ